MTAKVLGFPQAGSHVPKISQPVPAKKVKRPKHWNPAKLFVVAKAVRP